MKQYITVEQYKEIFEINPLQVNKITKDINIKEKHKFFTIGKMIEIIKKKHDRLEIICTDDGRDKDYYFIKSPEYTGGDFEYEDYELCDCLWEAVKKVL